MNWLTPALSSAVISMAVFVAAYTYLCVRWWRRRWRQSDVGLWALGWAAYLGQRLQPLLLMKESVSSPII